MGEGESHAKTGKEVGSLEMANDTPRVPMPDALLEKLPKLYRALWHEEDAICAIVSTSHVEHALRSLLRKHFVNGNTAQGLLDPMKRALGQLHSAPSAAYCLGLISSACKANIERIGTIRNLFAHSIDDATFADAKIAEICAALTLPTGDDDFPSSDELYSTAQSRFVRVVSLTAGLLLGDAIREEHREARADLWGS